LIFEFVLLHFEVAVVREQTLDDFLFLIKKKSVTLGLEEAKRTINNALTQFL
jgi:hypothetical protein